jgi:hypothetical protein
LLTFSTTVPLQVPARAAAAAAAARAIAGLPPHERINLPSNSEDLVSIYGSNPQGPPVDDLEEVFYLEVGAAFSKMQVASCSAPAGLDVFEFE